MNMGILISKKELEIRGLWEEAKKFIKPREEDKDRWLYHMNNYQILLTKQEAESLGLI